MSAQGTAATELSPQRQFFRETPGTTGTGTWEQCGAHTGEARHEPFWLRLPSPVQERPACTPHPSATRPVHPTPAAATPCTASPQAPRRWPPPCSPMPRRAPRPRRATSWWGVHPRCPARWRRSWPPFTQGRTPPSPISTLAVAWLGARCGWSRWTTASRPSARWKTPTNWLKTKAWWPCSARPAPRRYWRCCPTCRRPRHR